MPDTDRHRKVLVMLARSPSNAADIRHLKARSRRQSLALALAASAGSAVALGGALLGAFTLWQAWTFEAPAFAVRGSAILLLSVLAACSVRALRLPGSDPGANTAPQLVERELLRTVRSITVMRLGLAACGAAAVLGLAGSALRYAEGRPPALSPLVDLAVLAVCAAGLLRWGFGLRAELDRLLGLRAAFRHDPATRLEARP